MEDHSAQLNRGTHGAMLDRRKTIVPSLTGGTHGAMLDRWKTIKPSLTGGTHGAMLDRKQTIVPSLTGGVILEQVADMVPCSSGGRNGTMHDRWRI
jgi:hypothetical protein